MNLHLIKRRSIAIVKYSQVAFYVARNESMIRIIVNSEQVMIKFALILSIKQLR